MKKVIGVIIQNSAGNVLMQLRDDKVKEFPMHWVILGGHIKGDESPEECTLREVEEEAGIKLDYIKFFKKYIYKDIEQHIFYSKFDGVIKKENITEGTDMDFFSREEISRLKMGFNIKSILEDFFKEDGKNRKG